MDSELRALVVGIGFKPLEAKPADFQSASFRPTEKQLKPANE